MKVCGWGLEKDLQGARRWGCHPDVIMTSMRPMRYRSSAFSTSVQEYSTVQYGTVIQHCVWVSFRCAQAIDEFTSR